MRIALAVFWLHVGTMAHQNNKQGAEDRFYEPANVHFLQTATIRPIHRLAESSEVAVDNVGKMIQTYANEIIYRKRTG